MYSWLTNDPSKKPKPLICPHCGSNLGNCGTGTRPTTITVKCSKCDKEVTFHCP
jgi:transcription elongation factor Elf1